MASDWQMCVSLGISVVRARVASAFGVDQGCLLFGALRWRVVNAHQHLRWSSHS